MIPEIDEMLTIDPPPLGRFRARLMDGDEVEVGADDYSFVVIDHPISSATSDDLTARAERAAAACVEQLIAP